MAVITIESQPPALSTSKNSIAYKVSVPGTAGTVLCKIWVEDSMYSGTFREVGLLKARFDSSYQSVIQLQDYLHAQLDYFLPQHNSQLQQAHSLCKRYLVHFDTVSIADLPTLVSEGKITIDTDSKYVLRAGFAFHSFPERGALLLPEGKSLLTQKPLDRGITTGQYEYLYYLLPQDHTTISLSFTIYYSDNSSHTENLGSQGSFRQYQVLVVPVGYNARSYNSFDAVKEIASIRFDITAEAVGTFSVTLRPFTPKYPSQQREFYYFSPSLGGLESLVATGQATRTDSYERALSERQVPHNYEAGFAQKELLKVTTTPTYKQSIGFQSKADYLAFIELLHAQKAYIREGSQLLPILITDKKRKLLQDGSHLYAYEFTYQIAQPTL